MEAFAMPDGLPEDPHYLGPSDQVRNQIILALYRMPPEVASFAVDQCFFSSLGVPADIRGLVLPKDIATDRWIILLLERESDDEEGALTTIAEEVAHAWLGHEYW